MKKLTTTFFCISAATMILCSIPSPKFFTSHAISEEPFIEQELNYLTENASTFDAENYEHDKNNITNIDSANYNNDISIAKIIVYGGGKVIATPDVAYVSVGVESVNSNLQTAIKENNDTIISIIQCLNSKNIAENDIKTKYYSVYQSHDYLTSEKFQEYHVINTLEYKTTDLENLGSTIAELTNLGVNRVEDIQFDCSTIADCYQNALKLALDDAKSKAKSFTNKDLIIDKITEECVYTSMPYRSIEALTANVDSIKSGNIEVEAKITVVFK